MSNDGSKLLEKFGGALVNTYLYISRSDFWKGDLPMHTRLHNNKVLNMILHSKEDSGPLALDLPLMRVWFN